MISLAQTSKYTLIWRAAGAKKLGILAYLVRKSLLESLKKEQIFWPPKAATPKKVQNTQNLGFLGNLRFLNKGGGFMTGGGG